MTFTHNIRAANQQDLRYILEIMNEAIEKTTAIYDYTLKDERYFNNWFQEKKINRCPVFIYQHNDVPVAYGSYAQFRPKEGYQFSVEHSVYVLPAYRNKGIGRLLLQQLISYAKQNNIHCMIAGIDAENFTSIELHKKLGFEQVGLIKESAYKFDRWLDLVFMQLLLK